MKTTFNPRQILKLLIFVGFYATMLLLSYAFLHNLIRLFSDTPSTTSKFVSFLYLAGSCVILLTSFSKIQTYRKRRYLSVVLSPLLDKRVLHESGEYYMSYKKSEYILYKDNIFYKEEIDRFHHNNVDNQKELKNRIKSVLDSRYSEKMKLKNKEDLLYGWDGYTSDIVKRDDKIKQIVD